MNSRIEAVLAEHSDWRCKGFRQQIIYCAADGCDWEQEVPMPASAQAAHRAHQAAVLDAVMFSDVAPLLAALDAIESLPHEDYCCIKGCPGFGLATCGKVFKYGDECDGSECSCFMSGPLRAIHEALNPNFEQHETGSPMFSDEAMERAAKTLNPRAWDTTAIFLVPFGMTLEQVQRKDRDKARMQAKAFIAALRGDA